MKTGLLTPEEHTIIMELKVWLDELVGNRLTGFLLFGSKARGDHEEGSDIDVAIIVTGLTRELKNKILDKVADLEMKYLLPLSTLVLSEADFTFLKRRERRLALDIEQEGIPL